MSRTRIYGKSLVVMKDAIAEQPEGVLMKHATAVLSRNLLEQMKIAHHFGIDVDVDSVKDFERDGDDSIVIGYRFTGRQKRNVLQRILWAIKL